MLDLVYALSVVIYGLVLLACLVATFLEGRISQPGWDLGRFIGLGLCFLWPLITLVIAVAAFSGEPGRKLLQRYFLEPEPEVNASSTFYEVDG